MAEVAGRTININLSWMQKTDLLIAIGVVAIIIMLIIPLPTFMLDGLIAFNMMFSLIVLLITMYTRNPADFSVFPTILLIGTVFRLALNVSSTRLILTQGQSFGGKIIRAFGEFVVAGNYVVGIIIFLIIVAVQFIVITKGATRISEVAARFALDAMPNKYMAIDTELNQGVIDEKEAMRRREEIRREADFYGAMDGASKFVSGDVKVGLLITIINIVGGIAIGVLSRGESMSSALQTYVRFTVGDGLVSQIPSLLMATAAGIIVTRSVSQESFGQDITKQFTMQPKVMWIASGFLGFMVLIPGFPKLALISLSGLMAFLASRIEKKASAEKEQKKKEEEVARKAPENVADLVIVEPLQLEIGGGLIPLVDKAQGGDLVDRVVNVRRQLALSLGLVVPPVRIRDNVSLDFTEYRIIINGVEVGKYKVKTNKLLAIKTPDVVEEIEGEDTYEPAHNMPAKWINPANRDKAEMMGYSVVDPTTVITTHFQELLKQNAPDILGKQEVKQLLENLRDMSPAVYDELNKSNIPLGAVQRVLQNLIVEGVSIRNMVKIVETIIDYWDKIRNTDLITDLVRITLKKQITRQNLDKYGSLNTIVAGPNVEEAIGDAIEYTEQGIVVSLAPDIQSRIIERVADTLSNTMEISKKVIVSSSRIRMALRGIIASSFPTIPVMAYEEIDTSVNINEVARFDI